MPVSRGSRYSYCASCTWQPALLCAGALSENIENESAPVHDAHAELFLDRPRLRGRELVVDHDEIALVVRYDLLYFLQFARAEKAARVGDWRSARPWRPCPAPAVSTSAASSSIEISVERSSASMLDAESPASTARSLFCVKS